MGQIATVIGCTTYYDLKRKAENRGTMEECCKPIHGQLTEKKNLTHKMLVNDIMLLF